MNSLRVALIYNAKAGKGKIKEYLSDIIEKLYKLNNKLELFVYSTQYSGHATEIVENIINNVDYIICCGGDGTLSEVQRGIIKSNSSKAIGYIPCGTVNDFARSIELSNNLIDNIGIINNDSIERYDCGSFILDSNISEEKTFVYVSAFGLFTSTSYSTPQEVKNTLGKAAYALEGLKELSNLKSYKLKIKLDDNEEIEDDFLLGCISNSKSVGGFKLYNEDADMKDGVFEVILVKDFNKKKEFPSSVEDIIVRRKARKIIIESDESLGFTLDGEFGGSGKHIEISNLHKRMYLLKNKELGQN